MFIILLIILLWCFSYIFHEFWKVLSLPKFFSKISTDIFIKSKYQYIHGYRYFYPWCTHVGDGVLIIMLYNTWDVHHHNMSNDRPVLLKVMPHFIWMIWRTFVNNGESLSRSQLLLGNSCLLPHTTSMPGGFNFRSDPLFIHYQRPYPHAGPIYI